MVRQKKTSFLHSPDPRETLSGILTRTHRSSLRINTVKNILRANIDCWRRNAIKRTFVICVECNYVLSSECIDFVLYM